MAWDIQEEAFICWFPSGFRVTMFRAVMEKYKARGYVRYVNDYALDKLLFKG